MPEPRSAAELLRATSSNWTGGLEALAPPVSVQSTDPPAAASTDREESPQPVSDVVPGSRAWRKKHRASPAKLRQMRRSIGSSRASDLDNLDGDVAESDGLSVNMDTALEYERLPQP